MEQIKEDYVSFETAKLLKEKEFDVEVVHYYLQSQDGNNHSKSKVMSIKELLGRNWNAYLPTRVSCPTQALVLKWLRIKHNIYIHSESCPDNKWFNVIEDISEKGYIRENGTKRMMPRMLQASDKEFNSPEEAIEAAILYTLNHLI